MDEIINSCIEGLKELADEKRKQLSTYYYPTSMEVIGVTSPNIKLVLKELRNVIKKEPPYKKLELAVSFVKTNVFECQQIAYGLIHMEKTLQKTLNTKFLDDLMGTQDNWVSTDSYACYVHGVAWNLDIIDSDRILSMLSSDNLWTKRIAVVSAVALNRKSHGGKGDTPHTLMVCENVIDDHRDMVQKALSWALRSLIAHDKTSVQHFLDKHWDKLSGRVRRETTNKLATGRKNSNPKTFQ